MAGGGAMGHGREVGETGQDGLGAGVGLLLVLRNVWAVPGLLAEVERDLFPVSTETM